MYADRKGSLERAAAADDMGSDAEEDMMIMMKIIIVIIINRNRIHGEGLLFVVGEKGNLVAYRSCWKLQKYQRG